MVKTLDWTNYNMVLDIFMALWTVKAWNSNYCYRTSKSLDLYFHRYFRYQKFLVVYALTEFDDFFFSLKKLCNKTQIIVISKKFSSSSGIGPLNMWQNKAIPRIRFQLLFNYSACSRKSVVKNSFRVPFFMYSRVRFNKIRFICHKYILWWRYICVWKYVFLRQYWFFCFRFLKKRRIPKYTAIADYSLTACIHIRKIINGVYYSREHCAESPLTVIRTRRTLNNYMLPINIIGNNIFQVLTIQNYYYARSNLRLIHSVGHFVISSISWSTCKLISFLHRFNRNPNTLPNQILVGS